MTATLTSRRSGAVSLIGVDVTPRAIEICQVRRDSSGDESLRGVRLLEDAATEQSWGERFARIAGILRRRGYHGSGIVLAAPTDACVSALLEMPSKAQDVPIAKLVRMELAREHRLEPGGIESAWWDVPDPLRQGSGRPVMSIGCPADVLRSIEHAAAAHGLEVAAFDSRPLALARGAAERPTRQWSLICDLGADAAGVVVAHEGRVVIEHHSADASLSALWTRIAADCRTDRAVAQRLCDLVPLRQMPERRNMSFAAPRVTRAVTEHIEAVIRGVVQCQQYHRHRYGQAGGELARTVVGEPWLTSRFVASMQERGENHWTIAPPGHGAARGLALWTAEDRA